MNDVKDSFYEELKCVFDKFPEHHMTILLGEFNVKVSREVSLSIQEIQHNKLLL
jgi:hypothetical protein